MQAFCALLQLPLHTVYIAHISKHCGGDDGGGDDGGGDDGGGVVGGGDDGHGDDDNDDADGACYSNGDH